MTPEMQQQIEEQQPLFGALITEPDGVSFTRDELAGVPVEITEPVGGAVNRDLVVLYLHGGGYSNGLAAWARRGNRALGFRIKLSNHYPGITDWHPAFRFQQPMRMSWRFINI